MNGSMALFLVPFGILAVFQLIRFGRSFQGQQQAIAASGLQPAAAGTLIGVAFLAVMLILAIGAGLFWAFRPKAPSPIPETSTSVPAR